MHASPKSWIAWLLVFFTVAFLAPKSSAQGTGEIQVFKASGLPAEIIRTNGTIIPARIGEFVSSGDCIKTPAHSYLTLLLSNGALLGIQPSTELLIETFRQQPKLTSQRRPGSRQLEHKTRPEKRPSSPKYPHLEPTLPL